MLRRPPLVLVSMAGAAALALAACSGPAEPADPAPGAPSPTQAAPSPEATTSGPDDTVSTVVAGLVVHQSDADVETTVERLQAAVDEAGMVVETIDHGRAAADAGIELEPTVLVMGGNPEAGTPVMQAEQEAGLELPQKFLVWQVGEDVFVGYNSVEYLAEQVDLDDDTVLQPLGEGSAAIATEASGTEEQIADGSFTDDDDISVETVDSDADAATTLDRLLTAFDEGALVRLGEVDHAAAAEQIGEQLDPTTVVFGGRTEVGTPFMQEAQTMGIDLPLRFLVSQDDDGEVDVSYPDMSDIAERHGVTGLAENVAMVEQATATVAAAAAGDTDGD